MKNGSRKTKAAVEPEEAALQAGLVYVNDDEPGIRRVRSGRGFRYLGPGGAAVSDLRERRRIKTLAVPPAWTDVWICASPRGHLQATGRDARRRKQYRYHALWRETRDRTKYDRMIEFGEALVGIRKRVREDIELPDHPKEKVLATLVRLIDLTYMRVGNARYAKQNGSYGLTTMRGRHVDVNGAKIRFEFRGKGGKMHEVDVRDPRIARIVRRCQEIPGQLLFQYLDEEGTRGPIASDDVNAYLHEITGKDFTAKDFRTWAGTVLALQALYEAPAAGSEQDARVTVNEAIEVVAGELRNTVAVCRACYVFPGVIDAYLDGSLADLRIRPVRTKGTAAADRLRPHEAALLRMLRSARSAPKEPSTALRKSIKAARSRKRAPRKRAA